jgi:isocitrate dehydrogenase
LAKYPAHGAKPLLPNMPVTPTIFKLDINPLIMSKEMEEEVIVGVDLFIESAQQPEEVAEKCLKHTLINSS